MISSHTLNSPDNCRLLSAGLTDGGTAGLIWGFVGVSLGFTLVYASVAEMASMYVGIHGLFLILLTYKGPRLLVGSTTGYRNLHRERDRSS